MTAMSAIRRQAAELAFRGRHRAAARLYEVVVAHAERDPHSAMKLGELRRKLNEPRGALRAYELASALFRGAGFSLKAQAVDRVVAGLERALEA